MPVVILDVDDVKSLEFAIVENVQRQDLNPLKKQEDIKDLIDEFNYNQDKLSKFIGKSRSYIANSLKIVVAFLKKFWLDGRRKRFYQLGHARSLIGLKMQLNC